MVGHRNPSGNRRARGLIALEYGLVLLAFVALMTGVGEMYRVSMYDQALARATHIGALAAGRDAGACSEAFQAAFATDAAARWLFDRDDDGAIAFAEGGEGDPEVALEFTADQDGLEGGVAFDVPGCGDAGNLLRVRTTVSMRTRFGVRIRRTAEGWAVNQG